MKETFQRFCDQVCAAVPRATDRERQEIRQELMDHLEDRTLDMMERNWEPEEAARRAVEAMGNAEEIGKALNHQLKPLWLWIGWIAKILVCCVLFAATMAFGSRIQGVLVNLEARWMELDHYYFSQEDMIKTWEIDESVDMGDFAVRFFQTGLELAPGGHQLRVRSVIYAKNPLYDATTRVMDGVTGVLDGTWRTADTGIYGKSVRYCDYTYPLDDDRPESVNMATDNHHGSFSVDFGIDWSDVP